MTPLYREDSAHKVRGGLAGRVGQSLSAGGRPMDVLPEYIAGRTPREIAHELNNESILPPRERRWNASTINGNMQRDTGIIQAVADGVPSDELRLCQIPHQVACAIGPVRTVG